MGRRFCTQLACMLSLRIGLAAGKEERGLRRRALLPQDRLQP